ncbi:hypothetical protein K8352_14005 [Flavobacteriaceae bacterium F89]|uniref:Uncharacterized protein n=1 Tax=Cerina litoralis TaxID=2874477 RepID=A0AAE3EWZ1_9FLAO|nr:hypothetical protein [Cerina litoralis]MCG2461869.1 hypothetical protein [Cerina litoralis]
MKLHQLRSSYLMVSGLLFICFPALANVLDICPQQKDLTIKSEWFKNDILGVWEYTAENVPYEYSTGIIYITKPEKELKVKVVIGESSLEGINVVEDKNEVRFQVYVEGQMVDVNLSVRGNDLSGQGSTTDGIFPLSGKRKG